MSRLQKKKSLSEKKKKKITEPEGLMDSAENTSKLSSAKLPATPAAVKSNTRKEKAITAEKKAGEDNFFQKAMAFFREVQVELKKVTWPTRKQTTGTTIVVIIFVFIIAAFLGLFDYSLSRLVQVVLT